MRATAFLFFTFFRATVFGAIPEDMNPPEKQVDGFAMFNDLSKDAATKKASEMARADFEKSIYRIFVVGRRPLENAYDDYLKQHYHVLVTPIAGCVVSDGIIGAEQGYNTTIKPLLNQKFGHDIFKEAEQATGK